MPLLQCPLVAGTHRLHALYGPRPLWPLRPTSKAHRATASVLREGLHERRPDRSELSAVRGPMSPLSLAAYGCFPPSASSTESRTSTCWRGRCPSQAKIRPTPLCGRPESWRRWELSLRSALAPLHARDASDDEGRTAGVRRFLVPVANLAKPLPEARGPASGDELLAAVPRPLLPVGSEGFAHLFDYAWRMLCRLRCIADWRSGLPNDYVGTSLDSFSNERFVWDSSFTAMCTAWDGAHSRILPPSTASIRGR